MLKKQAAVRKPVVVLRPRTWTTFYLQRGTAVVGTVHRSAGGRLELILHKNVVLRESEGPIALLRHQAWSDDEDEDDDE